MEITKILIYTMILSLLSGCGIKFVYRHFGGPIEPASAVIDALGDKEDATGQYLIGDDGSVSYIVDRLEIKLLPLSDDMLNRQFASISNYASGYTKANPYSEPSNPYTYGEWTPPGEDQPPPRFNTFSLSVKNYTYPKVQIDPKDIYIDSPNGRHYNALSLSALIEYYWPYAIAYSGNARKKFSDRRDLLRRTLFNNDIIFSGQETTGNVVFAALDYDVEEFVVHINNMPLRYDYKGDPIETINITFPFKRQVHFAKNWPIREN